MLGGVPKAFNTTFKEQTSKEMHGGKERGKMWKKVLPAVVLVLFAKKITDRERAFLLNVFYLLSLTSSVQAKELKSKSTFGPITHRGGFRTLEGVVVILFWDAYLLL